MDKYFEIRWHGRGGQGTVTAAKVLAEAALKEGKYVQAFPEYGPERMGAPLRAFNRISNHPITIYCPVINPDLIAIVDPTLIGAVDLREGMKEETIFVVNSPKGPEEIAKKLEIDGKNPIFSVNATGISLECLGKALPNTPMLGAVIKASGLIELETLLEQIEISFQKKFGERIIKGNIDSIRKAYKEVKRYG